MKWLKITLFASLVILVTLVAIFIASSYTPPEPVQSPLKQFQQQQEAQAQDTNLGR